ncbi:hypothetical protein OG912_38055 (plasmid) [Streptomyces sp. NBC_00464]|uniref:hypothetical protein n=1 Tax=Streptomyces sp. NBC_00464 TaxID=2975751 RepID=UPI002E170736
MHEPRRRVYGSDHDDPHPYAETGHDYRELTGGPLDGLLVDVTGWTQEQIMTGAYLITPHSVYGPSGRAAYAPTLSHLDGPWVWEGDIP